MLLNLPLALIGGVFALIITSGELSIPAIIGFIALFGIEEHLSVRECILQGSLDRLNPILMTALSSALAMIPLAINGDLPGNEIQSPMAKVILGGLLTSTLLNGFTTGCTARRARLLTPPIPLKTNKTFPRYE